MIYKLKAFVGPTLVWEYVDLLKQAGIEATAGTEHIYIESEGENAEAAAWNALVDLKKKHGTDYCLRFRKVSSK